MRSNTLRTGIIVLLALLPALPVAAQTPQFQPLMTGQRVSSLVAAGESVFAGLPKGGVIEWDRETGETLRLLTRRDGLGGHFVSDMAWTGVNLWIATEDGGLTAIADPGGPGETMRRYSSLLPSLDVTAVGGVVVGDNERVYYGTDGAGIGEIVSGLPGAYFDTQNGLIDDVIDDLAVTETMVLIATPSGLSRFGANTFTNYPYDDPEQDAPEDMEVGPDGAVWAAMADGIHRWDDDARAWEYVGGAGRYFDLAVDGDTVWAVTWNSVLELVDGTGNTTALPADPSGFDLVVATIAAADGEAWIGGMLRPEGYVPMGSLTSAPVIAAAADPDAALRGINTLQIGVAGGLDGVAIDSRDRPWVGGREGDGLASFDGSSWYNATQRARAENDSNGFFDFSGGLLAMARDGDALWFNQFTRGLVRFVPAEQPGGPEEWLLLEPSNSPILGDGFLNLAAHPDGVIFAGTDNSTFGGTDNSVLGVDVLVDQERPRDPASWLHLYPSVLGGNVIGAITVERRDVIWFAVRNAGLLRWDVNGLGAGPDAPLTWFDTSDDHWSDPILNVPGSALELDQANAIAVAADGSIFAGGQGVVQFSFEPILQLASLRGEWRQKESALDTGLLSQSVSGLGIDHNGALWVLSTGGLNRLRFLESGLVIDAFTDLANYLTFDPSFYSPGAIVPLPGGEYRDLAVAEDRRSLVISSDLGAALVEVPEFIEEVDEGELATAYLYPNPVTGEDGAAYLNVGGIQVNSEKPLRVEVLNLVGQIVYRSSELASGEQVWDLWNKTNEVASGLYVVKIIYGGKTVVRTLAVAR